jgi:Protein of unknown function (DUF3500)
VRALKSVVSSKSCLDARTVNSTESALTMFRYACLIVCSFAFVGAGAHASDAPDPVPSMAKAANAFLAALDTAKREKASSPFHSDERLNWHFVPKERQGVSIKLMSPEERQAALALLKSSLSSSGFKKVETIRNLEEVLHAISGSPRRDPELYYFTVFGEPAEKGAWGWRYEGHHTSFNWTVVDGKLVASTPQFTGANPADVGAGPRKGTRALAVEEDLGRTLVKSLSEEQMKVAVVSDTPPFGSSAPLGIVTGNSREAAIQDGKGIAYSTLTEAQQGLLLSLIQEYASVQSPAVAQARLARIRADLPNVKFAWMGGREKGQGHYYRIQGSTFLIEYDNTQDDANHIHGVWREFKGDWGKDVLAEHYRTAPHHAKERRGDKDAKADAKTPKVVK